MARTAFILKVKADRLDEYRRRHASVWPEMQDALRATGWKNYSLFLRPDGMLVGYVETDDFDASRAAMAKLEVNDRWQSQMTEFFEEIDGAAPDAAMVELEEIFHLPPG
jgi:L-rhamnose mutarotase